MDTKTQFKKESLIEVDFMAVIHFQKRAAKERVAIKASGNTRWYLYDKDVAVIGLMMKPEGRARIKGVWVSPEYRGLGVGTALTDEVIRMAIERGAYMIDVYAHNPAFYLDRGFTLAGKNQHGVDYLTRII